MSDTVVKAVKDATIWLGEVTVLPSDDSSTLERLRYGIYKITMGKQAALRKRNQRSPAGSSSDDDTQVEALEPPGRILGRHNRRHNQHVQAGQIEQRLAADFEKAEAADEEKAKQHGDKPAEDEHRERRLLLSEIRKIYADTNAAQPKQYSYTEWAYYIKLLGQDESDSRYHKLPQASQDAPGSHGEGTKEQHHSGDERSQQQQGADPLPDFVRPGDPSSVRWSWIGQRSPLMGDKEESEWLLVSPSLLTITEI